VSYGKWGNCGKSDHWEEETFGASTKPLGMSSKNVPVESQQLGMCKWTDVCDEPVPLLILLSV
jgi:hypothetical protein